MFEIKKRDGTGRVGTLTIDDLIITTPTVLMIDHPRFKIDVPESISIMSLTVEDGSPILQGIPLDGIEWIHRDVKLSTIPVERAQDLASMGSEEEITRARYIPGMGSVNEYAQWVYCGVDLVDTTSSVQLARRGLRQTSYGPVQNSEWTSDRCHCLGCEDGSDNIYDFTSILTHNVLASLSEMAVIREFIRRGRLRHLVDMRIRSHPELVSIQRLLDSKHYPYFQRQLPFIGGGVVGISEDVIHSPEVKWYHERMKGYRKPFGDVLLLLPCSARKPYSTSRSHRFFSGVTSDFLGLVHEVIITSPLGMVPREIENFYPPANYDISVTGSWTGEEQKLVREMLTELFKENEYRVVINHTPYEFIDSIIDDLIGGSINDQAGGALDDLSDGTVDNLSGNAMDDTSGSTMDNQSGSAMDNPSLGSRRIERYSTVRNHRPASNESLGELRRILRELTLRKSGEGGDERERIRVAPRSRIKFEIFRSMWRFQFGIDTLKELDNLENPKIVGKFPFFKLVDGTQLAMMVPKVNRISLTLAGGGLLKRMEKNRVFIEDFKPSGDVFAVGIVKADNDIHVGDEVVVMYDEEIRGVGVAAMCSDELNLGKRGVGVRLRHRKK